MEWMRVRAKQQELLRNNPSQLTRNGIWNLGKETFSFIQTQPFSPKDADREETVHEMLGCYFAVNWLGQLH